MSLKINRITAAVAAVAAMAVMSVGVASAGATTLKLKFTNWVVSGTLTAKKLNQTISLPEGATFNGTALVELLPGPTFNGPITGTLFVPPFKAKVSLLGIPAEIGVKFTQAGALAGSVAPSTVNKNKIVVDVPAMANVAFTSLTEAGITVPLECETAEPLAFDLNTELFAFDLGTTGSTFVGTTTFPSVKCGGLTGLVEGPLLTSLLSGPDNPYSISIAPPPPPPPPPPSE